MSPDPRAPCIVGVGSRTWHPDDAVPSGAPEPLAMWDDVLDRAVADAGGARVPVPDSLDVVYCQTWQYDDPCERLCERRGIAPAHRRYSGIGGTTPQVLIQEAAERIGRGESDVAAVVGGEALDTKRRHRKAGERWTGSFPPATRPEFPWEAPFHPAEVAHEVFQAWLTFALFDVARRGRLGVAPAAYREDLGALWHDFSRVAARNPEAWFPVERTAAEIATPTAANRMVATPYTKYMVSVMDVDMAAAVVLASHERADALGVPPDRRVYLRGCHRASDPVYVAEHPDLSRSPAMGAAAAGALAGAGIGVDDLAHLDVYSCFGSSVHFARDALGLAPGDDRPLTVTGGLPYHGGPGSNYLTHAVAQMVRVLREDPGACGLVTGVGMHMTKHVAAVYSTDPGTGRGPAATTAPAPPAPPRPIRERHTGPATVATATAVYGRTGAPEWGIAVCDTGDGARCYARIEDPDLLASVAAEEWVGRRVHVASHPGRKGANLVTHA